MISFIMKFRPVRVEMHLVDREMDGQTHKHNEANCRFSQFCECAWKTQSLWYVSPGETQGFLMLLTQFMYVFVVLRTIRSVFLWRGLTDWSRAGCTHSGLWDVTSIFVGNVNQSVQKYNHLDTSGIGNNSVNLFNYKTIMCQCCR